MSKDDWDPNEGPEGPPTLFQRFLILIGYNLSDQSKLKRACINHLDTRKVVEDRASQLRAAEQAQMRAAENLTHLSTSRAPDNQVRAAKERILETISAFSDAKRSYEEAVAAQQKAQEVQKMCFERLAENEDEEYANEVVQETYREWMEDRVSDGHGWWQGGE